MERDNNSKDSLILIQPSNYIFFKFPNSSVPKQLLSNYLIKKFEKTGWKVFLMKKLDLKILMILQFSALFGIVEKKNIWNINKKRQNI